jgi:fructokinase
MLKSGPYVIVGLGELLWDVLPGGLQLGGAPANFAYYAAALGNQGIIASRVGNDELGREALRRLMQLGLKTFHVQIDLSHPTGTVRVQVDERGQPEFTITDEAAWDFLEWTPQWQELAAQADAVCFGSLAQRSPQSRATISQFLQTTRGDCLRVFDVNLRQSFYSAEILSESLQWAKVVKLNDAELPKLVEILELSSDSDNERVRRLIQAFDLDLVCVTQGARGSLLVTESGAVEHPGFPVTVADAVGAGDAFTAALVHHYLRQAPLERINEAANRLGSWVATQVGATPFVGQDVLKHIIGEAEE